MKLIVFGATGGIGSQVVTQALAAGHEVTAVARHPAAISIKHERLEVVKGDVLDADTMPTFAGQDMVVSALGARDRASTVVYSQGVANIIRGMHTAHVRRLFCISASGLDPGPFIQRVFARPVLWAILKEMYSDLVRMETVVKESGLDWTIVRPPMLNDKPRTGKYRVAVNKHLPGCWVISRADVADYILTQLTNPDSYCGLVEVAY